MDEDLKAYLGAMETRLKAHVDGRLDAVEARLREFMTQADFDLETKIVGEFWKWRRSSDIRTREAIGDSAATAAKAQLLSERLLAYRVSELKRAEKARHDTMRE
jgi:hypothetical protein